MEDVLETDGVSSRKKFFDDDLPATDLMVLKQMANDMNYLPSQYLWYERILLRDRIMVAKGDVVKAIEEVDLLASTAGPSILNERSSFYLVEGFILLSFGESQCVLCLAKNYKRDSVDLELCKKIGVYSKRFEMIVVDLTQFYYIRMFKCGEQRLDFHVSPFDFS